jgi:hypothetical protein
MSKHLISILVATGLLLAGSPLHAELRWSAKEKAMDHGAMSGGQHQGGGHSGHNMRRGKTVYLQDSKGAKLWMITPKLESRVLELTDEKGKLEIPSTGMVSYHALVASRQEEGLHESSLRYEYLRGKPTGRSPAELMANEKLPLEIVPDPMAREHWRFYSQNDHAFVVRFQGEPKSGVWVGLASSNGSSLEATSDAEGRVVFTLPDDFSNVRTGRSNNRPAEFTVRAGLTNEGTLYRSNFTAPYSVNPSHWKSTNVGLFMLLAGFVTGIVVMRKGRPENNNKKKGRAA